MTMAFLEQLLRRLGYIKLSTYGFVLTPDNRVMPMLAAGPLPPQWQSEPGDTLPSAPPMASMLPPQPLAPTPTPPPPIPQAPPPPAAAIAAKPEPPAGGDAEEEWEWRMAMARARGRGDNTEIVPGQAKRMARGTAPPPMAQTSAPAKSLVPRPVATKPPLRRVGPPPGIGRRLRSAVHRQPVVRTVATAERTRKNLRRVDKPIPLPPRPDRPALKLVDPDTVVTLTKPGKPSFGNAPLPRLTKRLAAG